MSQTGVDVENRSRPQASRKLLANGDTRGPGISAPLEPPPIKKGTSYEEHVALSNELPYPMSNGSRALQRDVRDAISFTAGGRSAKISTFRGGKIEKLESESRHLAPGLR